MAQLTTTPIGKLCTSLPSTIHVRHLVILLVLPWMTLTELAGIQIGPLSTPTHTWPKMLSEPELGTFPSVPQELIPDELKLIVLLLTKVLGLSSSLL